MRRAAENPADDHSQISGCTVFRPFFVAKPQSFKPVLRRMANLFLALCGIYTVMAGAGRYMLPSETDEMQRCYRAWRENYNCRLAL